MAAHDDPPHRWHQVVASRHSHVPSSVVPASSRGASHEMLSHAYGRQSRCRLCLWMKGGGAARGYAISAVCPSRTGTLERHSGAGVTGHRATEPGLRVKMTGGFRVPILPLERETGRCPRWPGNVLVRWRVRSTNHSRDGGNNGPRVEKIKWDLGRNAQRLALFNSSTAAAVVSYDTCGGVWFQGSERAGGVGVPGDGSDAVRRHHLHRRLRRNVQLLGTSALPALRLRLPDVVGGRRCPLALLQPRVMVHAWPALDEGG